MEFYFFYPLNNLNILVINNSTQVERVLGQQHEQQETDATVSLNVPACGANCIFRATVQARPAFTLHK